MTYAEKLKDPRWQKKRLDVMQRDGFKCTRCNCDTLTLHVHHLKYLAEREPWQYDLSDLTTLCQDCHSLISAEDDAFLYGVRRWCFEHPRAARAIMGILCNSDKIQLITIYNMIKVFTLKTPESK